jgi:hypothetical protein
MLVAILFEACTIFISFLPSFLRLFSSIATVAQSIKWLGNDLDDQGSIPGRGRERIFFHHRVQTVSEVHPASYPMSTVALLLGLKRPGREAENLPPSSAEVKNV